jgi:hypothetical protein
MRVVAKCWVNYDGVWHKGGEEFDVKDFAEVKDYADPAEPSEDFPKVRLTEKKRGRPRKAE